MKLDRNTLKKLIVETLQEAEIPKDAYLDDPEHISQASTDRTYEPPSGPLPEEEMSLTDIAGYFRSVGEEMNQRVEQLKNMPKIKMRMITDEEVAAARKEAEEARKTMEEVSKNLETALANLKK